jgi:hypothetical protein
MKEQKQKDTLELASECPNSLPKHVDTSLRDNENICDIAEASACSPVYKIEEV